jgi:hypothetical protein
MNAKEVTVPYFRLKPIDIIWLWFLIICMHRTTILLPEDLKQSAERQALKEGLSLSELIRRRLSEKLEEESNKPSAFFSRHPWTGSAPDDLASRHDEHLYGE